MLEHHERVEKSSGKTIPANVLSVSNSHRKQSEIKKEMQTLGSRSQRITVEKNVNTSQSSMQTLSLPLSLAQQTEGIREWEFLS